MLATSAFPLCNFIFYAVLGIQNVHVVAGSFFRNWWFYSAVLVVTTVFTLSLVATKVAQTLSYFAFLTVVCNNGVLHCKIL